MAPAIKNVISTWSLIIAAVCAKDHFYPLSYSGKPSRSYSRKTHFVMAVSASEGLILVDIPTKMGY
jgi:hypothetical protein